MATPLANGLARALNFSPIPQPNPFGRIAAAGSIDGFPILVGYTMRGRQHTVAVLIRFKEQSLEVSPDTLTDQIARTREFLAAIGKEQGPLGRNISLIAGRNQILLFWAYLFRRPQPAQAAAAARSLLAVLKTQAKPIGTDCETCGAQRRGELATTREILTVICADCRARAAQEDIQAIKKYEALPTNPVLGALMGLGTMIVSAIVWGGFAHVTNHIFPYAAIVIGAGMAWVVNKGVGKVTWYGRVLTMILTVGAVFLGHFMYITLNVARTYQLPLTWDLLIQLIPHSGKLVFAHPAGYFSAFLGLLGAGYTLYTNRPPSLKRTFTVVGSP